MNGLRLFGNGAVLVCAGRNRVERQKNVSEESMRDIEILDCTLGQPSGKVRIMLRYYSQVSEIDRDSGMGFVVSLGENPSREMVERTPAALLRLSRCGAGLCAGIEEATITAGSFLGVRSAPCRKSGDASSAAPDFGPVCVADFIGPCDRSKGDVA